jgi:hypothetical protein
MATTYFVQAQTPGPQDKPRPAPSPEQEPTPIQDPIPGNEPTPDGSLPKQDPMILVVGERMQIFL